MVKKMSTSLFYRFFAAQCYATLRSPAGHRMWWKSRNGTRNNQRLVDSAAVLRDPKIYHRGDFVAVSKLITRRTARRVARALRCSFDKSLSSDPTVCGFVSFEPCIQRGSPRAKLLTEVRRVVGLFSQRGVGSDLLYAGCELRSVKWGPASALRCGMSDVASSESSPLVVLTFLGEYGTGSLASRLVAGARVFSGKCGTGRWVDTGSGHVSFAVVLQPCFAAWLRAVVDAMFVCDRVTRFARRTAFVRNIFAARSRGPAPAAQVFDLRGYSDIFLRDLRSKNRQRRCAEKMMKL
jgi:hypothetical protein